MSIFGPPNIEELKQKRDVKGLIRALGYVKDAKVRGGAAEALGELKDARAVEPLIGALKDRYTDVRKAAAEALGKIGAPAVELLIAALKDKRMDRYVHEAAAEALGKSGDARAIEPLIAALKDEDTDVRRYATKSLGEIGIPAVELLIAALKDEDRVVRRGAVKTLGELKDARAVEPLIAVLKDKNKYVREAAAEALGNLMDARAVEPLIGALKDKDADVCRKAAETLDKIGWKPGQNEAGAAYWIGKRDWEECIRIGVLAIEPLIAVLKDRDWCVRKAATEALGKIGDARAIESLLAALKDEDENVRIKAAEALGNIGDARAVEPLIAALKNQDVREVATEALGKIGTPAVEPLIAALKDAKWVWVVRREVVNALIHIYRAGQLDETDKKLIFAHRLEITSPHDDRSSGCGGDHTDIAAIEFPL